MFKNLFARLTGGSGDKSAHEGRPEQSATWPDAASIDTPEGGTKALDLDDVFGMLSTRRRRDILRYLDTKSSEVDRGTLAEHIAARENDKAPDTITATERKRVYISLYQSHLPQLANTKAITYDKQSGRITRGPNFDLFLAYLPAEELTGGSSNPRSGQSIPAIQS